MSTAEHFSRQERDAWLKYSETQTSENLADWRRKLQLLNDELEHRTRLLAERVRESRRTA